MSQNNKPASQRIPVRVLNSYKEQTELSQAQAPPQNSEPKIDDPAPAPVVDTHQEPQAQPSPIPNEAGTDWEAMAKRQLAEMENFKKRQLRLAEESVMVEKERLLRLILPVADNLTRALSQPETGSESLRQGIELTRRELNRLLQAEGITRILTIGQPFDPTWHDALASTPSDEPSGTILQEVEAGYKLGERLLRPAKVVVAA